MSLTADRHNRPAAAPLLESLEDRILLTTLFGGDTFEYIDASGQTIRVALRGDIIAEFLAANIDQSSPNPYAQDLVVGDVPGTFLQSAMGQSPDILGGRGGVNGLSIIGPTPIFDPLYGPGNLTNMTLTDVTDRINLDALASEDAIGNGATYSFNVTTAHVPQPDGTTADRKIVQLVRLSTTTGNGTVESMLQWASLNEDVMSNLVGTLPQINAFAVDPITGLGYAVGDVVGANGNISMLYRINRTTGLIETVGPVTNVSHLGNARGGQLGGVQAITFNSVGQLFLLTQDPAGGGLLNNTSLVAVDKATGQFTDSQTIGLHNAAGPLASLYLGMAFLPGNDSTLYAVDATGQLVRIPVPNAPYPPFVLVAPVGVVTDGTNTTALNIQGLAFAHDINDRVVLVGLEHTTTGARLDYIDLNTAVATPECQAGSIRNVNDIASYTQPGDSRPLLFAVDSMAGQLIRGSAVAMPVDKDGISIVTSIQGADFHPRTGSPDDEQLFFTGRDGTSDRLYSIDTSKLNRSAIQNTMTMRGTLWSSTTDVRTITSIVWDQTSDSTATLTVVQTGGLLAATGGAALYDINFAAGGATLTNFMPITQIINGATQDLSNITGIEYVNDNPLQAEPYVYAIQSGANAELLRITRATGRVYVVGTLPTATTPVVGANLQGIAWNPLVYNPFTNQFGALIATDATADDLVILDYRDRFSKADLFSIFVSQASENASIAIAYVPPFDPANPTVPRTMDPFGGTAGSLRINPAQGGQMIVISSGGDGRVWIGARSQNLFPDPINDEDMWPMYKWTVGQVGVRPAGYDDLPDDPTANLSAGITVAQSLLTFIDNQPGLVQHMMGLNVGQAHSMAVDRNGNIFLIDKDGLDPNGMPINQDQIIQVNSATGLAMSAVGLFSGLTAVNGVQAMAYGDPQMNGIQQLYAIVSTPSYVPTQVVHQPLPGDVFNEAATALTVAPGNIMYAIGANVDGNYNLYRINTPASGPMTVSAPLEIFEVLPDGTTSPVRNIYTLASSTIDGTLYVIGRDNLGHQALYTLNPNPTNLVPGGLQAQAMRVAELSDSGLSETDPFTGLAFMKLSNSTEALFASQSRADGSYLFQVDPASANVTEMSGGTLGTGKILVNGGGASVVVAGMAFDTNGNLIAVDRGGDAGAGRLIKVNLADPALSQALTLAGSIPADYMGYTSDVSGLFYTINTGGAGTDDEILVTRGNLPTLGTVALTMNAGILTGADFTPIALVGGGSVSKVTAMAFSPKAGSIPGMQGLYVLADGKLYEINPLTGALLSAGDTIQAHNSVGSSYNVTISSMSFDAVGTLYGEDPYYGRLVDIDLGSLGTGTVWAGTRTATVAGSLRPTVGSIAYDYANDRFLAVDNCTANNINGGTGSATMFKLLGTQSDSAVGQSMYRIMIGGVVTGQVYSSGSMDLFYAGWLITGDALGLYQGDLVAATSPPQRPDNFFFAGDLRNLIVSGSLGTLDDSGLDKPVYLTGFDMHIMGKLGQLKTLADFIGSADVEDQNGIPNLPDGSFSLPLGQLNGVDITYHQEVEDRNIAGIGNAPVDGWLFERFELYNGANFTNDTFATAQYVGSVRSATSGQPDIIRIDGTLEGAGPSVAGGTDWVDYYAVPLMAGQTITVQLVTSPNPLEVFDPDGRLIASNLSLNDPAAVLNEPFRFTADRPGAYRFVVGMAPPASGTYNITVFSGPYEMLIQDVGDLAVGGFVVGGNVFAPAYRDPTDENQINQQNNPIQTDSPVFRIRRGDMGAFSVGSDFLSQDTSTIQVDQGGLRSVVAAQTGIPNGSGWMEGIYIQTAQDIGRLQATNGTWLDLEYVSCGGSVQLIDAAATLWLELHANGGLGVLHAGNMATSPPSIITVNADNKGADGIIDLIDVTGNLGAGGVGGPAITTGPGGDVRYMRVGGSVFRDSYFGSPPPEGDSYTFTPTPGHSSVTVRDDSGGEIVLTPIPANCDEFGNPLTDPATGQLATATLTYRTYGIRGSGGSVLIDVTSTGGLKVGSNSFGNGSPVEVGTITANGAGRGVVITPGLPDFNTGAPTASTLALAPDAGTNLLVDISGTSANPIDVFHIIGGTFTRISNTTGGEIVSVTATSIGDLSTVGTLGLAETHTGQVVEGIAVVSDARPFRLQKNAIAVTGDVVSASARRGLGNFIIGGTLGTLTADAGGTPNPGDGDFRGIAGPILVTRDINSVQIGEGIAPTGTGEFSWAGLYAQGTIWYVTNQGLSSDIHGIIDGQTGVQQISLRDGSIINTEITTIGIGETTVFDGGSVVGGPIGNINLTGRGGMIGTMVLGGVIGNTTVKGGFGILDCWYAFATFTGTLGNITADGYGVRSVFFTGGLRMGNLTATGTGNLLNVLDYAPSVRYSQDGDWDPIFNERLSRLNDLHLFLGTTLADPIITGISESGVIENVYAQVNQSIGVVRAFRLQGQPPAAGLSAQLAKIFGILNVANSFDAADYIGGIITLNTILGGLEVTTGRLGIFSPGGDVYGLSMTIAGRIDRIDMKGSLLANSSITSSGPNGDINFFHVGGNVDGDIHAAGRIGTILIDGDVTGNITIDGNNRTGNVLALMRLGGSLTRGSLDITGNVGTIDVAGSLGASGDALTISGNLTALHVGTNPHLNGSDMALNFSITGNLTSMDIAGRSTGTIYVGGDATRINVQSDPATVNSTLVSGKIDVIGNLRSLTVNGGDLDAMVTAGRDITSATITNGSLGSDGAFVSSYGNIGAVTITHGDLLGSVRTPDGNISSITVTGSDLGGQSTIQAAALNSLNVTGSVISGATIDLSGAVNSFHIGHDVQAGASIQLGSVPLILIGGSALGQMTIGFSPLRTTLNVGGDLGGYVQIDGNAIVTARGDMRDKSTLIIVGDLPTFTVTGAVHGTAVVDGSGGIFHFGSLAGAVITTGFDLQKLNLDGDSANSVVQVGISRGTPLPANQPAPSPLPPPTPDDGLLQSTVIPLDPYKAKLDGQWLGSIAASDGKVYFGDSTHADNASGMLFQYDPATGATNVVAPNLSAICGENDQVNVPQGKLHSPIVEANGWIFFDTHLGNYWTAAEEAYTGSHLIGYQLGSLEAGHAVFRDYGIMIPHYTGYAGLTVDPTGQNIWALVTPWRPEDAAVSGAHLVRTNINSGQMTDFGPIDPSTHGQESDFFIFADDRGDCWATVNNGTDKLYVARGATGHMESFAHALPPMMHTTQKGVVSPYQGKTFWEWGQAIDGEHALFTEADDSAQDPNLYVSGELYEFDASKMAAGDVADAFHQVAFIGGSELGITYSNGKVYYARRSDGAWQPKIDGMADANGQTWDPSLDTGVRLHLYSVDVTQSDPPIVDYGAIVDSQGQFPWRLESMSARDGKVFMTGDWIWTGNVPDSYHTYRRLVDEAPDPSDPYVKLVRGQVFVVADLNTQPQDNGSATPHQPALFGTGSIQETGRIATLGGLTLGGKMTNTIIAAGGSINLVTVPGGMTNSSISSGFVLGGSGIQAAINDPTPLDSLAELDATRGAADRTLLWGNMGPVTIGKPWQVHSALTAGVDPGNDGAFGTADDNVTSSKSGGISKFTAMPNTFLDRNSYFLADGGAFGAIIGYTLDSNPQTGIAVNDPLETLQTTINGGTTRQINVGGHTVTVQVSGPGSVEVHDGSTSDTVLDTLVVRGGTSQTSIVITTDVPGSVSIGRLLTQDNSTIGTFRFDGDLVGDGTSDVDLWIDGPVNSFTVRDLGGDGFTGKIGGDVTTMSIRNQNAAQLYIGGKVSTFNVVASNADPVLKNLATAPSDGINTMATDSAGNLWVFDSKTGKLSKVNPTTGQALATATVTDALGGGALTLTGMDFTGSDVLLAVATLFDLSPTRLVGPAAPAPVDLHGLAVSPTGQILSVEEAAYVPIGQLGGNYNILAMAAGQSKLLAVDDLGPNLALFNITLNSMGQVTGFTTVGNIVMKVSGAAVTNIHAMSFDAFNNRFLAIGNVTSQYGHQQVLLSIDAATAQATFVAALQDAGGAVNYVAPDPQHPATIPDSVEGLAAPHTSGTMYVVRSIGGVDRLFTLDTASGQLTEVVGGAGNGQVKVSGAAVNLAGLAFDPSGYLIALDTPTGRTIRIRTNSPAGSWALDLNGSVTTGASALAIDPNGQMYVVDNVQAGRPLFGNIGRDRLVSFDPATGVTQPIGTLSYSGNGYFNDVLCLGFDDAGKLYALVRELDGTGGAASIAGQPNGVALVSIETTPTADGHVRVDGPTAVGSAGVLLDAGGVTNNFTALAVDGNGQLWAIRRTLDGLHDELVRLTITGTTTSLNDVQVGAVDTGIVGMGFTEGGQLVAYSVAGGKADLVNVNTVDAAHSQRLSAAQGTLNPAIDGFAIGRSGTHYSSYAFDTGGAGGMFYTSAGLTPTLGAVNTSTGLFTRLQGLVQDSAGTPITSPVVDIAVDPNNPGHVYAVTADSRLFEFDNQTGAFVRLAGTITDSQTHLVLPISQIEFDADGRLLGIDSKLNRLVVIGTADAQAAALTETSAVNPADIVAVTFDVHTGTLLGFDTSSDRFVAFRGTDANHLAGVTATAVPQMNIGKAGSAGYGGRVVTTGNSLDTITATGNFSGSLVTAGTITRFTQTGGDFAGALAADRTITSVNITGGDFKAGGSVQTDLGLTTFTLTGGDLGGLLSAGSAGTITVHGSGLASADLLVIGNVKQVTFDGRFDGTMEFGSAGSISVGRELGAQALIEVQGPINTLNLGGMTAGSLVALNNTAGSITIGTVDSGTLSVRRSVNSIRTADTTDAILAVGINLGSLTVTGNATRTLFSSGVWIGDDHQYNTADDVIIGGAIGTATFQKNFTDSAVVAGVLPDLSVGPGMPDDKRAFVGNPTATDISQVDSATAGGVLVSTLGTLNFIGDVVSTQSAIGHIPVVAAANGIGRIVQRLRGNPIAHRVYGDPFGAPTVISASLINATDVQVVFSEPIDTGSLTVSRDADGDGTLGGPGDYTGSITVTDVQGHVLNGITLLYTTQTIPGAVQGVVTIRRTAGFPNGCIVTLSGSLTGPAIVDRSGLRSALRDFDRDGVPSVGEDTAGTILDGDGNGVEGGNYVLIASLHDTSTGFADAVKVDPVVDAGTVHIQGTFGPYDTGLEGMNFIIDSGMGLFTTLGDVDVYSFSAQAYQFVRLDLQTADVARMGLFYLNTQGTADPSDDTYQLVARWDINRVTNAITQTDRPKALQESFELPRTGQYFIALYGQQDPNAVTSPVTPTNPDGSVPYQLKVTLASSDDLLDGVANGYINTQPNDPIAYVSDTIGEHHNVLGAAADKRLVYLDFAGGLATDYHAIVNQDVRFRAMDLSLIDSQLAGLEQQVIEGNAATGVTGIVDHILSIYRHLPNSAVNVQRITTTDPKAALAQWLAADEGIYFTTVDPQTWGLDPKTDFTTVFVGETDNAVLGAGLYGIASDIPVAGETPSENAGIFVQNFVDPVTGATLLTGTTLAQKMNQASMMLANVAAHELGHTLGLNHQTTDRVNYILEPTPTDPNSGPAVMGYALVNIMETQEMYFGNAPLADAEFPMGIPPIGAPANYPVASIDTADMLAWWFG